MPSLALFACYAVLLTICSCTESHQSSAVSGESSLPRHLNAKHSLHNGHGLGFATAKESSSAVKSVHSKFAAISKNDPKARIVTSEDGGWAWHEAKWYDNESMLESWTSVGEEDVEDKPGANSGSSSQPLDAEDEVVYETTRDAQCETPPGSDDELEASDTRQRTPWTSVVRSGNVNVIDDPSMNRKDPSASAAKDESWGVVALPGSAPHWAGCRFHLAAGSLEEASDATIVALASQALTGKTRSALMLTSDAVGELRAIARQIQIDLPRTSVEAFHDPRARETAALFRILFAFALLHPDVRYNQAMSALAAALLTREFLRAQSIPKESLSRQKGFVVLDLAGRSDSGPPPFREVAAYRRIVEVMSVPHMSRMYDATLSGWPAMFAAVRREFAAIARAAGREQEASALWRHIDDVAPIELLLMDMIMTHFGRFAASDDFADVVHRRLLQTRDAYTLARATAYVLLEHAETMLSLDPEHAAKYVREIRTRQPLPSARVRRVYGPPVIGPPVCGPVEPQRPSFAAAVIPEPNVVEMARIMARRISRRGFLNTLSTIMGV